MQKIEKENQAEVEYEALSLNGSIVTFDDGSASTGREVDDVRRPPST